MIIAGLDYSMTSPAICIYDTNTSNEFKNLKFFNLNTVKKYNGVYDNITIDLLPKSFDHPMERFNFISDWAIKILLENKVESVILEGYAMGSSAGRVFDIAENTCLIKDKMHKNNIKYDTPAPTAVKKVFCGSGGAKKDVMCETFYHKLGVKICDIILCTQYKSPENDMVDAYANMMMYFNKE